MSADIEDRVDESEAGDEAVEETLRAEVEVLEEENRRLRRDYTRARQSQYRRSALGMAAVGVLAAAGALAFPDSRAVLFALGGTGLFAAILTYYLTPEQVIPASVGERVYRALAENEGALASELGLQSVRVYVPTGDPDLGVRLFVPQHAAYELPPVSELADVLVVPETDAGRGVAFRPAGDSLFAEFEDSLADDLAGDPATLAEQLRDGLVEQFELARTVRPTVAEGGGQVIFGVAGSAYGPVDRFDHPIPSFLAVGLARGLSVPVDVEVSEADDDRVDQLVTCSWSSEEGSVAPSDTEE